MVATGKSQDAKHNQHEIDASREHVWKHYAMSNYMPKHQQTKAKAMGGKHANKTNLETY